MKMQSLLFTAILLTSSLFSISGQDIDLILENAIEKFTLAESKTRYIGLGVFHYADKNIAGSFSSFLEEKLSLVINQTPHFKLVDRDKLDTILEETRFGLSGLLDESTRIEPGKLKGLQGILSGKYYDEGESIRLYLELLELETGLIVQTAEIYLQKSQIPSNISILPDNYRDVLSIIDELAEVDSSQEGFLSVKAWTKRGDGGTYRDGENLVINFYSNNDCYIKIYHIDVEGTISLIFPNHIYSDNFISANRIYKIPDNRYNFNFELSPPFGTEFVKVLSSVNQFQFVENSFEELDMIDEEIVSKGLRVTPKEDQTSVITISYTIIE